MNITEPTLASCVASYGRELARQRALRIATATLYFPLRARLLEALAAGQLNINDLAVLPDRELLARAGVVLELDAPADISEN